jgi:starvation-inducible outer membrane lipoprotein
MRLINFKILALTFFILLTGCSSIGKGIAEAVLEKQDQDDNRVCEIWGENLPASSRSLNTLTAK